MSDEGCEDEPNHDSWNRCVRRGALTIGIGMLIGTVASVFLVSETPIMMGTGLGVGWAMKYCRSQFRKEAEKKKEQPESSFCTCCPDESTNEPEDHVPCPLKDEGPEETCSCCSSNQKEADDECSIKSKLQQRSCPDPSPPVPSCPEQKSQEPVCDCCGH